MIRNDFEKYEKQVYISKDWVVPFSQIKKDSHVILYGAGDVGQAYFQQIKLTNYCSIVAWVDKEYKLYREIGLDVTDISIINNYSFDYILIAVSDSENARSINSYLLSNGVEQEKILWNGFERKPLVKNTIEHNLIEPVRKEMFYVLNYKNISINSSRWYEYCATIESMLEKEKLIIPRVVLQLTQKCTLKCKGCNNLMPRYTKPENFDLKEVISGLKIFTDKVDRILVLELIGGEPLVYPYLIDVIEAIKTINKIDFFEITTNGTIVPSDGIMKSLKETDSCLRISKYSKSVKTDEIIKKCKEYGVRFSIMDELVWYDSSSIENRALSDYEKSIIASNCTSYKLCKTISCNKFFCCARAASLFDLGISKDEEDYINLLTCEKEDILNFYKKNKAIACDFCTCMDEWREIDAGEQEQLHKI